MLTKTFIDNFYNKLPAYAADRVVVAVNEYTITELSEDRFDVRDDKGRKHYFKYSELTTLKTAKERCKKYNDKKRKEHIKTLERDIKEWQKRLEKAVTSKDYSDDGYCDW